jgi:hypothetical protein
MAASRVGFQRDRPLLHRQPADERHRRTGTLTADRHPGGGDRGDHLAQVWRTGDGTLWTYVTTLPVGENITALTTFNGDRYANQTGNPGVEGGEIWSSSDGTNWTESGSPGFGFGASRQMRIRSLFTFGGYLYANADNSCYPGSSPRPGCQQYGWELWRLAGAGPPLCTVSAIRRDGAGSYSGDDQEDVTVQAPAGLASLSNVQFSNGSVDVPTIAAGTTQPVVITATKATQGVPTAWGFKVTDETGDTVPCS